MQIKTTMSCHFTSTSKAITKIVKDITLSEINGHKKTNTGLEEAQAGIKLPGEISITSDMQMTPPLWQKVKN